MTPDQLQSLMLVAVTVLGVWLAVKFITWFVDLLKQLVKPAAVVFLPPGVALLGLTYGTGQVYTTGQDWLIAYGLLLAFWVFVLIVVFKPFSDDGK